MSQRIVVGFEPGTDWSRLKDELIGLGAESVNEPSSADPSVLVATIPSHRQLDEFLQRASRLNGVRYAEPDAWQSSF